MMKAWNAKYTTSSAKFPKPTSSVPLKPHTTISPTPTPPPLPTMLHVYNTIFRVMRFFGSNNFKLFEKDPSTKSSTFHHPEAHHPNIYPTVHISFSEAGFSYFKYLTIKLLFIAYLLFFVSRFVSMVYCEDPRYCSGKDKGVRLLAIACYIIEQTMVSGIYAWTHFKRNRISKFFNTFNATDWVVFDGDTPSRQKFIQKHKKIYIRVILYFPIITSISILVIGLNQANHPHFKAHMTSMFLAEGEPFFSTPTTSILTIISFSMEFLLVIYSYLALYQFFFFSIIVARSFKWMLEHLNSSVPGEILNYNVVQSKVRKYERLRWLMNEYNSLFSGLLLLCKVTMILQIVVMSYIPLKRMHVLPYTSLMIFVTVVIHYSIQVIIVLTEMGTVYYESGEFRDTWMRRLIRDDFMNGCGDEEFGIESVRKMYRVRGLLDGSNAFGFECGRCYIVGRGTVLTFFSIVTSYLIVMMQLQI